MTLQEETKNLGALKQLIELGTRLTGSLAGATVGALTVGPVGALIGAAVGPSVTAVMNALAAQVLSETFSRRELQRTGAVMAYTVTKVKEKIAAGAEVRKDGFFDPDATDRSAADEVAEGIIRVAQREHEEKKLRFYGNLLANLAFDKSVDTAYANLLIRTADTLSYRQICLLVLFLAQLSSPLELRSQSYRGHPTDITDANLPILIEIYDLYAHSLVNGSGSAWLGVADVTPAQTRVQGMGVTLYSLMELQTIDVNDVKVLVSLLK